MNSTPQFSVVEEIIAVISKPSTQFTNLNRFYNSIVFITITLLFQETLAWKIQIANNSIIYAKNFLSDQITLQ